jgi:hypothetical protein
MIWSTVGLIVGPEDLGPAFLQDHHPKVSALIEFGANKAALFVEREEIIDDNFLVDSIVGQFAHVYSILVGFKRAEDVLDAVVALGNHCNS